ncbi:FG-GAP-like repeat-containing protein [Okeania sp.]|uniref:FG-GAP-like repeat-containing protein n=1 Tax=Okeania sp. TaxID=3100323 RepID=UPI002B4B47AD|nr:FG-GAP-like repeat-containing protein [Okeania sp.]MEB3342994.1 FG-GAP-like repeat-containing protein [Okeania sp.]
MDNPLPEDNPSLLVEPISIFPEIEYWPGSYLSPETTDLVIQDAWTEVRDELADFLLAPDFATDMQTAFGSEVNLESARDYIEDILAGERLPDFRVLPTADMNPALGGFDVLTGTVYLADSLLAGTEDGILVDVVLEEVGHYLDGLLNEEDSAGDEGKIFERLVSGEPLSEWELLRIRDEDDVVEILDGSLLFQVEASQAIDFDLAGSLTVGSSPTAVAVEDFNQDGIADLAVANSNISVLLGTSFGSFGAAINFDVAGDPDSLAVEDFNGDGIPDLAVANRLSEEISVLIGIADGSFGAATNFDVGGRTDSIVAEDFNRDGFVDLAVSSGNSSSFRGEIEVLLGEGNGNFGGATSFRVGAFPRSIGVGDFNRDGIFDLVVANNNSNNISVLTGVGDGSFGQLTNYNVGSRPISIAVEDFNQDGIADFAVGNWSSDNISVLLGTSFGGFGTAINFDVGDGPYSVAVEDFNQDGIADLAVANQRSDNVSVLPGIGDGSFSQAINFAVGDGPYPLASEDFNGDGIPDLAVGNEYSDDVSILINTTPVNFTPNISISDAKITEGNKNKTARFIVTLDNPSDEIVKVNYTTANQTAKVNQDYKQTKGTLTFQPGQTEKTIPVPIIGDKRDEKNEKFKVNLSKPRNAELQDKQAIGTIIDNDEPPTPKISIGDAKVTEGNRGRKNMEFEVKLDNSSSQTVKVNYATKDGSARSGKDYQKQNGVLTFKPGQKKKTVSIPILGDTNDENNEKFQVNLSKPRNAQLSDRKGIGTIRDNDTQTQNSQNPGQGDTSEEFADATNLGFLSLEQTSRVDNIGLLTGTNDRDTEDFYRFRVKKEGLVSIFVDGFVQNLGIKLYGENEELINQSNADDIQPEVIQTSLDPGIYYLEVFPVGSSATGYRLIANIV